MTLAELLSDSIGAGGLTREVTGIEYDSRRVAPGNVFFAFSGAKADGRAFAEDALTRGAAAVVSESPAPESFAGLWLKVPHGRKALALASRRFYMAARDVALVGITGTNGKTTASYLIDSILRASGAVTGLVGTIEYHVAGEVRKAVNTTPESLDLYRLLSELRERGGTQATMEVSSHALALGRVWGVGFHTAVFTNLTRDHLDLHGTMDAYFRAKCELFEGQSTAPPAHAVINYDDPPGHRIPLAANTTLWSYGKSSEALLRPSKLESDFNGLRFDVKHARGTVAVNSPLVGHINVLNILAAVGAGLSFGLSDETIAAGIADCRAVPGRFERIDAGQSFLVVVDYAHTDDALKNVIAVARALKPKRVITLFGCGGDRDRTKRPLMGEAAAKFSDYVVLTSDNPRSEDPLDIMNDALVGLRRHDTPHHVEPDREAAIRHAIAHALPGDIVILAGKGHEDYQVLRDRTIHFDDREIARKVLTAA